MKLIVFSWRDPTHPRAGGSEVYLFNLFKYLENMFDDVICYTSTYPNAPKVGSIGKVKIVRSGYDYTPILIALKAKEQLTNTRDTLILENINHIPFYTPILYPGKPLVSIIHHTASTQLYIEAHILAPVIDFFERAITPLFYRHKTVIVPSKSTKQQLLKLGFREVQVVPPGIDYENLSTHSKKYRKKHHDLIYFGRIARYKQVDHVVRSLTFVKKDFPEVNLIIAGKVSSKSYLKQLRNLVMKLNLHENVEIKTNVSETEKIMLLSESLIYVTTSVREGWGIAVIEANACGTTAIAYDVPGLRDSIVHGKTGLLVPYGDIEALAKAVIHLFKHNELREGLSRNAIEWAKRFSCEKTAKEFITILNNYSQYSEFL